MINHKFLLISLIIIIYSSIGASSASADIDYFELTGNDIYWVGFTTIITPYGNNADIEFVSNYYLPNNAEYTILESRLKRNGKLISEIELYQNDEKKNFSDFFNLEIYDDGNFEISMKELTLYESTEFRLKYKVKPSEGFIEINDYQTSVSCINNFHLSQDHLYDKYIFRIPMVNAHNLHIEFELSQLQNGKNVTWAPVSKIYETDEYLEIRYSFWNKYLVDKIPIEDEDIITSVNYNSDYSFVTKFVIEYETFRYEWFIAILISSIVAIFSFIGGALWVKKE